MVRQIRVTKQPRMFPLKDLPPDFPPLLYLRLDLVEIKKKLKNGLPFLPPPVREKKTPLFPQISSTGEINLQAKDQEAREPPEELTPSAEVAPTVPPPTIPAEPSSTPATAADKVLFALLGAEPSANKTSSASGKEQPEPAAPSEKTENRPSSAPPSSPDAADPSPPEKTQPEPEPDPDAHLSPEEKERKEREEYTWRFRILKKQYKNLVVPEFSEYSPIETIKTQYNQIIRELQLDDNVDTYRTYLFGSWLAIEFVCTQWIGIDLSGFTKHQAMMFHKYNKLLIELGEKSKSGWGSNLPVEVRLIGLVVFQAGIFYLIKVVSEKFGCSVSELFSVFMGQPIETQTSGETSGANPRKEPPESNFGGLGAMLSGLMGSMGSMGAGGAPPPPTKPPSPTQMRGPSIRAEDIRSRRTEKTS